MDPIVLACPYCAGRIETEQADESRVTNCSHCGWPVTVPAQSAPPLPDLAASLATRSSPSPTPPPSPLTLAEPTKTILNRRGEPVPLRRLSPKERVRYRQRLNWAFAAIGMAILAIALAVLLRLRP